MLSSDYSVQEMVRGTPLFRLLTNFITTPQTRQVKSNKTFNEVQRLNTMMLRFSASGVPDLLYRWMS